MTSWNYRVMDLTKEGEAEGGFGLIEVYYNDDGEITGWCPSLPFGDTVDDLVDDLAAMIDATGTPVLTRAELPDG